MATANQLQDLVSDPAPGAGVRYEIHMMKNGIENGRNFFSDGLNPASAGRVAVGPVDLIAGKLQFNTTQRAGAQAAYSYVMKLAKA